MKKETEKLFKAAYVTLARNFIHENKERYSRSELYINFEQYINQLELDAMIEILTELNVINSQ